jgi:small GTP-binding protein
MSSPTGSLPRTGNADGPALTPAAVEAVHAPHAHDKTLPPVRLMLVGDGAAGKSALLTRYVEGSYKTTFTTTVGAGREWKPVDIDGRRFRLDITDHSGNEMYANITCGYFRGGDGFLVVFDCTQRVSFERAESWLQRIAENAQGDDVARILVANKCEIDDTGGRVVSDEEARAFAERHGIQYFAVSAATGMGVAEAFEFLARQSLPHAERRKKETIDLGKDKGKGKGGGNGGKWTSAAGGAC